VIQVLIDSRAYGMSGIGRYIEFLIKNIISTSSISYTVLAYEDTLDWMREDLNKRGVSLLKSDLKPFSFREVFTGIRLFAKLARQFDLIHFTHTNAPFIIPKNSVMTIHDIIPLRLPYRLTAKLYLFMFLSLNIRRCRQIITVSEFTRKDIIKQFKAAENKSTTIYTRFHPIHTEEENPDIAGSIHQFFHEGRCFLYVGNRKPHKNLEFTIRVFDTLMSEYPDIRLVIAGNRFEEHDVIDSVLQHVEHTDRFLTLTEVSDTLLGFLYTRAYAVVLFSIYEGFGMPPIEAAAVGTPSLVSDKTSLPEIVGSDLCIVPIDDRGKTLEKIRLCLDDADYYESMKNHMLQRAEYFFSYDSISRIEQIYTSGKRHE